MLPNWYEATVMVVLAGGAAMVLGSALFVGLAIWYRFNPPKSNGVGSDCPGPR